MEPTISLTGEVVLEKGGPGSGPRPGQGKGGVTIKTRLNNGINRSSGGGETRTHYEFTTGPRNLLTAIAQLGEHRSEMVSNYGNIGCGHSWLEIDGQEIHPSDLEEVARDDAEMFPRSEYDLTTTKTPTDKARALIARVRANEYRGV
jgi:opacity protein-like surface antigen